MTRRAATTKTRRDLGKSPIFWDPTPWARVQTCKDGERDSGGVLEWDFS
eukprot:CAMPEP_0195014394 /NCGR_PEP_ID=MMETSP0326_2-20130528/15996_1 /TAXON_ID=2866 ORGANISM="Crypthecodinium cohnii, Strain Seligo" /NCGR_SAMPLE_ID=MMETSP0326_2 /ASSEMBLY_ACC=CAM_ASM_000348 /LENGTH=48 /DNA_ID= /DNA_START= /DNA_END= /DNA_ORIENTATION=